MSRGEDKHVYRIGYLCIQRYPNRICSGCTSACDEPVYVTGDVER